MYTHALIYSGNVVQEFKRVLGEYEFSNPLHRFNGVERWAMTLQPLTPGSNYNEMVDTRDPNLHVYLQAAGRADEMTVEICKPGGQEWGAKWVLYAIGHPHDGTQPIDVPIHLPDGTEMISTPEVFTADEATQLFMSYYKTGDIPEGYTLRPLEAFRDNNTSVDLRNAAHPRELQ